MSNYLSDLRPNFTPFEIDCGKIGAYQYDGNLKAELSAGRVDASVARDLLEDMLMVREMEEMIVKLRSGAYDPLPTFNYRGPTHVSIGQEGSSIGACSALEVEDYITSTHRGHGDSLGRGSQTLRRMAEEQLRDRVPQSQASEREDLLEEALEDHLYRTIAELFGKEDGYCRGRGGSMHIADYRVGHLGANALVGGNVPIATGASLGVRYLRKESVVCCFAGDGAYANGVTLESLNFAAQAQFVNEISDGYRFGLPIIFLIMNNHYCMTGRAEKRSRASRIWRAARQASPTTTCTLRLSMEWTSWLFATQCCGPGKVAETGTGRTSSSSIPTAIGDIRSVIPATSIEPGRKRRHGEKPIPSRP